MTASDFLERDSAEPDEPQAGLPIDVWRAVSAAIATGDSEAVNHAFRRAVDASTWELVEDTWHVGIRLITVNALEGNVIWVEQDHFAVMSHRFFETLSCEYEIMDTLMDRLTRSGTGRIVIDPNDGRYAEAFEAAVFLHGCIPGADRFTTLLVDDVAPYVEEPVDEFLLDDPDFDPYDPDTNSYRGIDEDRGGGVVAIREAWLPQSEVFDAAFQEVVSQYGQLFARVLRHHPTMWPLVDAHRASRCPYVEEFCLTRAARQRADEIDLSLDLFPHTMACAVCGDDFKRNKVAIEHTLLFGPPRYCRPCGRRAETGARLNRKDARAYLRRWFKSEGQLPHPQTLLRSDRPAKVTDEAARDEYMRRLQVEPTAESLKATFGAQFWVQVLAEAKLMGPNDSFKTARGSQSLASDGHHCRSLLERVVEEFMIARGVVHETEPRWPRHEHLNPKGLMRADWLLADGSYVECWGMDNDSYRAKILTKRQLAAESGIRLREVGPEDLHRLDELLLGIA